MIGRGKTALVVDPAEAVRHMVAVSLRVLKFDRVISVGSAEHAAEVLSAGAVDLALIDWQLEGRSGFDLAADIRIGRVPPRRDLPIIMLAWQAEPRSVLAAQGLKLNGLMVKPLAREAIERKVSAVLNPTPHGMANVRKAGPKRFLGQAL
jgi:DNA-binding response OmpR family regulator